MDGFFNSIGNWFGSLTLDGILTAVQNFLFAFGKIAQEFFNSLP